MTSVWSNPMGCRLPTPDLYKYSRPSTLSTATNDVCKYRNGRFEWKNLLGGRRHLSVINEYWDPFCRSPSLLKANSFAFVQVNKFLTHLFSRVNKRFLTSLLKLRFYILRKVIFPMCDWKYNIINVTST